MTGTSICEGGVTDMPAMLIFASGDVALVEVDVARAEAEDVDVRGVEPADADADAASAFVFSSALVRTNEAGPWSSQHTRRRAGASSGSGHRSRSFPPPAALSSSFSGRSSDLRYPVQCSLNPLLYPSSRCSPSRPQSHSGPLQNPRRMKHSHVRAIPEAQSAHPLAECET